MVPATVSRVDIVALWLSTKTSEHTRRAYAFTINRFLDEVAKPLTDVTLMDLAAWMEREGNSGLQPASVNRAVTAVKSLFSFCYETGYIRYNPGAALKRRPQRDSLAARILTEDQVRQLIGGAAPGRDRTLLTLLYFSGVRVSEVCGLRGGDLNERPGGGGQITVFGKGGRTRAIVLPPAIWHALCTLRGAGEAAVFRSRKGGGALDASRVRRIVYAAAQRAGLPGKISPHWMRHAHASHALDHNAPIHLVQATLGHSSVATTGRYLHARPAESSSMYLPSGSD